MAIISVSGRKSSGKDTVGNIIRFLSIEKEGFGFYWEDHPPTFEQWMYHHGDSNTGKFKIKKFADKLKDMVCLLIGCTREQLEDQEFKEKELGEEWWKYELTYTTYSRLSYSNDPEFHREIYSTREDAEKSIKGNLELDDSSVKITLVKLTPRLVLQLLGTDCVRNIIHSGAWVNATFAEYQGEVVIHNKYGPQQKAVIEYPNWIITDTRFPNELKAVKDRGGITIRVERSLGKQDLIYLDNGQVDLHPSETALDDAEFDYVIDNDGTMEELIDKVRHILIQEKFI